MATEAARSTLVTVDWDHGRIMHGGTVLAYIGVGIRNSAAIDAVNALANRFNAAPELLEALEQMLAVRERYIVATAGSNQGQWDPAIPPDVQAARAALAKARGAA